MQEFDYTTEARNLSDVAENMSKAVFAEKVCVPRPLRSTRKVLVMEFLDGDCIEMALREDIGNFSGLHAKESTSLQNLGANMLTAPLVEHPVSDSPNEETWVHRLLNWKFLSSFSISTLFKGWQFIRWLKSWWQSPTRTTAEVLELLLQIHGHQIFVDGCFQADPHPGNFLLMKDGRIGLLDFGQTKRLDIPQRRRLGALVQAVADEKEIGHAVRSIGITTVHNDPVFQEMIGIYVVGSMDQISKLVERETGNSSVKALKEFYCRMLAVDRMLDFPKELYLPLRSASLLRGLGLLLGHKINPAVSWSPYVAQIPPDLPSRRDQEQEKMRVYA